MLCLYLGEKWRNFFFQTKKKSFAIFRLGRAGNDQDFNLSWDNLGPSLVSIVIRIKLKSLFRYDGPHPENKSSPPYLTKKSFAILRLGRAGNDQDFNLSWDNLGPSLVSIVIRIKLKSLFQPIKI